MLSGFPPLSLSAQSDPASPAAPGGESPAPDGGPGAAAEAAAETAAGEAAAAAEAGTETGEEEPAPEGPDLRRIRQEIRTATMPELAAWCRELGLSEGGTREEMSRRLLDHFNLAESGAAEGEDAASRKIITIESARSAHYFTLDVVDEEYARLQGDVIVSLKDGDTVHRITAREMLFNRTRNLITASGGVEYIKESGDTVETFRGESITVNLDNWSSIFLDGVSERSLQNDETAYRFAGAVISRSGEEVTILDHASVTNAKSDESFWSLAASKIWLLPGSDFAIFNAVLKVGEIPVLYFPFFHYPADEVIFHPVLGYRSREGNFLQTTTYILGRPKASSSSESSITKILGSSADMEKRREGIFLRSTGKKVSDPDAASLKAIVDMYANLGYYFGTELTLPAKGLLGAIDLSAGLGLTRTVVKDSLGYTPFADYDGESEWNRAKFISWDVPFRYRFKTGGSLSGKFGSLSWNFPYYSDPFVDRDFVNNRSEEMDWVHIIQEGADQTELNSNENLLTSYNWEISGSLRPSLPFLAPYVSDISLNNSSLVNFRTRDLASTNPNYNEYAPNRKFFYPERISLYSVNGSISGTLLTLGGTGANREEAKPQEEDRWPLDNIGIPRSPWARDPAEIKGGEAEKLIPPVLNQRFDMPQAGGGLQLSVTYRITPTSNSDIQFRSSEARWPEYDKIDWGDVSSILVSAGGDASTTVNLNHLGGAFTNAFTLSGGGLWKRYTYINEEAENYTTSGVPDPAKIREAHRQNYSQTNFNSHYAYNFTLRPLYHSNVWGNSNLQYSLRGLLAKSEFTGTGDAPAWKILYGAWDRENLENHQLGATVSASVMDQVQSFVFTSNLPPEESMVSGNATLRAWISETNMNMRISNPEDAALRKFEPLYTTITLRFGSLGSFQHYMVYDPQIENWTIMNTSLSLAGFGAAFSMNRSRTYRLNYLQILDPSLPDDWILTGEEKLNPFEFSLRYNKSFSREGLWKKRLGFTANLNTSLTFDFQRYTYSRFSLSLGLTLNISNFLDLTLSILSENPALYRYFKNWSYLNMPENLPASEGDNFFLDLLNSFRFDDDEKRRSSGFKLRNFNLSATHYMGDWKAILGVTLVPYRPTGASRITMRNEISFVVQWTPISEIKTDIQYTKDEQWIVK
ncbi:MAG: LPS-assembly protein LptD [Treponema sp.]|jgi:hypothetical protein|nr:LPS-assembly protein LptD [Treponema sp.]